MSTIARGYLDSEAQLYPIPDPRQFGFFEAEQVNQRESLQQGFSNQALQIEQREPVFGLEFDVSEQEVLAKRIGNLFLFLFAREEAVDAGRVGYCTGAVVEETFLSGRKRILLGSSACVVTVSTMGCDMA